MPDAGDVIPIEQVQPLVLVVRGHQVLLDSDLAALYGVRTGALNQAVRRNPDRFPSDFMFQLDEAEWEALRSQFVTAKSRGGRRTLPYVFTEQGVAMLSSVLNSERAIRVNIAIMRAFVQLRQALAASDELARRLAEVERTVTEHGKALEVVVKAIREIVAKPLSPKKRIGFRGEE